MKKKKKNRTGKHNRVRGREKVGKKKERKCNKSGECDNSSSSTGCGGTTQNDERVNRNAILADCFGKQTNTDTADKKILQDFQQQQKVVLELR